MLKSVIFEKKYKLHIFKINCFKKFEYNIHYISCVYLGDSDVLVARDRLKGALRELLQHSDTGSSVDSGEENSVQDKNLIKKM